MSKQRSTTQVFGSGERAYIDGNYAVVVSREEGTCYMVTSRDYAGRKVTQKIRKDRLYKQRHAWIVRDEQRRKEERERQWTEARNALTEIEQVVRSYGLQCLIDCPEHMSTIYLAKSDGWWIEYPKLDEILERYEKLGLNIELVDE